MIAVGATIALSRDRLWLLATLAIGALAALPAVLYVQAHDSIADSIDNQAAVEQGVTTLLILLAGVAARPGAVRGAAPAASGAKGG